MAVLNLSKIIGKILKLISNLIIKKITKNKSVFNNFPKDEANGALQSKMSELM